MSPVGAERLRVLLAAATLPVLAVFSGVAAVLVIVAALAPQATFTGSNVLLATGPGWLAAFQVPLTLGGRELGLLPLGVTIAVAVLLARTAAGAAERLDCRTPHDAVPVVATIAGVHAVVGTTLSLVANGAYATADPLAAFCVPGLIAGGAASAGLAGRSGLFAALRPYTDAAAVAGLRAGLLGLAGLITAAAGVLAVVSAFSAPTMHALFEVSAPGFGSGFGMLLLSVAYLPNAVLATLGFMTGPGFSFGSVWVSPAGFEGGDVPAVPLLAGVPDAPAGWWPALLLLPAAVGAFVGWTLRGSSPDPYERLRSAGVAGAVVGFCCVVLGTFAGGRVGVNPGLVLPLGLLSVAAFCWIAVPAAAVAWLTGPRSTPAPDLHFVDEVQEEPEEPKGHFVDEVPPESDDSEEPEGQDASETPSEPEETDESEEHFVDEVRDEGEEPEGHFVDEVPSEGEEEPEEESAPERES